MAVVGASMSPYGAAGAQARPPEGFSARAGAWVLDGELCVTQAHEAFDPDGQLRDPELARRLCDLLEHLVQMLNPLREAV